MKELILKRGVLLFLIAALVCGGVLYASPSSSRAAAGVLYNVEILNASTTWDMANPGENNESPGVHQWAPTKEVQDARVVAWEGITFQMLVEKKAKTEVLKVGKTKTKASYYPVTILKKTFKAPMATFQIPNPGGDPYDFEIKTTLLKDAKGKLYVTGADVDVSTVQAEKKAVVSIGDGTTDPEGSMVITMEFTRGYVATAYGVTAVSEKKTITTWTTGQSSVLVKGSKSLFEGKSLPDDDPTGILPKPMVGTPVDLAAGTGTLVSTECLMNQSMMQVGPTDFLKGQVWQMMIWPDKSTKPAYPTPKPAAESTSAPTGEPTAPAAEIHTGLDINSKIGDLVANEYTAAVIEKCVPGRLADPAFKQAYGYTFDFIAPFAKDMFTPEAMKCLEDGFAAIK